MKRSTREKLATGWKPTTQAELDEYFGDLPDDDYFATAEKYGIDLFKIECTCKTRGMDDGNTTCWEHHDCTDGSCTHRE